MPTRRSRASTPREALKIPGVLAVITGNDLEGYKLHWMPTLAGDKQMVLPMDTVMYQSQEVGAIIATTQVHRGRRGRGGRRRLRAAAGHRRSVQGARAGRVRPASGPRPRQATNHIWHWESGDAAKADAALAAAEVRVVEDIYIPRIHVASIETCGCVADWDPVRGS